MTAFPIVPDRPLRVFTPAQASDLAIAAHQLLRTYVRRTPLGRVTELRCSCGSTIANRDEDEAFDLFCVHGLMAVRGFVAQLVAPDWAAQLFAAATARRSRRHLDAAIATQAALGTVIPPAADDSTAAWLERDLGPIVLDDDAHSQPDGYGEPTYPCGCLVLPALRFGHQLGCDKRLGGAL